MKVLTKVLGVFLLAFSIAHAKAPLITGGPVNAASYVLAGLPNGNIA
jgi:hypothetical protein